MSGRGQGSIYVTGMFDMLNFGDLLFPLVAAQALNRAIVPVAPTATPPWLSDALPPMAFADFARRCGPQDTVVIGGGHIIHAHALDLLPQYRAAGVAGWGGAALWLGASVVAAMAGAGLAWNAPGAPHPLPPDPDGLIAAALAAADHLALRDAASCAMLPAVMRDQAQVVPDPIAGITRLWSAADLAPEAAAFRAGRGLAPGAGLWTLHIRDRSLSGIGAEGVARGIDALAERLGLHPVLCALGAAHEDDATARAVAAHLRVAHTVLDRPPSLRHMAGVLAASALHSGSSLHGYMVAAAYGVPALLLGRPAYRKFAGFLGHSGAGDDLARSWPEVFERLPARRLQGRGPGMPDTVLAALEAHWAAIRSIVAAGPAPDRAPARTALLAGWLRGARAHLPPEALLRPFGKPARPLLAPAGAVPETGA
ncbi:polysaccharide pyruvyl transferase family protein [Gemmobacter denitrificans]|uniref:Polysaccharide pyruvyl transferase family protein n=1 Tax=Gemmobacter denitrificans TaxID=3123040 RepID=A0ABU8C047_9RHOB